MIKWLLNEVMNEAKISGKELAEKINVHPNTISRLRNDNKMPHINGELLDALCEALKCSPLDLIKFTPSTEPETKGSSEKIMESLSLLRKTASEITDDIICPRAEIPSHKIDDIKVKIPSHKIDDIKVKIPSHEIDDIKVKINDILVKNLHKFIFTD